MMEMAKITAKGQITVPVAVRKKLSLKEGDKVVFIEDDVGIRIVNSSSLTVNARPEPMDKARNNGPNPQTEI
jgi:AbrB family looped-hinge helix DNA binding protein